MADVTNPDKATEGEEAPTAVAARWVAELALSERAQEKFLQRVRKIQKRYKLERSDNAAKRQYAMLWSNTQTILPAVYSRPPEPVVSRRFKDDDQVGRIASEAVERALSYSIDKQDLDGVLKLNALDFVLNARSQTWERYVPTHGPQVVPKIPVLQLGPQDGEGFRDNEGNTYDADDVQEGPEGHYVEGEAYSPVVFEESVTDFVNIEDFGHTPGRTWDEVWYVWRRVFMTRAKLIERFGEEIGRKVQLDSGPKRDASRSSAETDVGRRAAIYEIWDKDARCVYWISKSYPDGPLDHREDPLGLDGFFPCPRPLFGTLANNSLIPVPDFAMYQDQAEEIDVLTAKIGSLQEGLKVVGFYAAEGKVDLNELLKAANMQLVAVVEWKSLKDDGGIGGRIEWWPLAQVVEALKACIDLRSQLIADIYQITGVADILRGASDPNETAAAQGIKAQWGAVRIRDRQKELARFARDVLRIKAEVISEHFSVETLEKMSGVKLPTAADKAQAQATAAQLTFGGQPIPDELTAILASPTWDDVEALLRDNATRSFRVDVETDSTIEPNETAEKAQTVEFMGAIGSMVSTWGPAVAAAPELAPMASAFIKWGARRFRAGRELETVIDATMDKLAQKAAIAPGADGGKGAAPQNTTPISVAQINLEREQLKQQGETQRAEIEAQTARGDQQLHAGDQALKAAQVQPFPMMGAAG